MKSIQDEKDFDWSQNKIKLSANNSIVYATALIANGDVFKASNFLLDATSRHKNNTELIKLYKQIELYSQQLTTTKLRLTKEEKAHKKVMNLFPKYLSTKAAGKDSSKLYEKITKELKKITSRHPYLPTRFEYLFELEDPMIYKQIYKEAQQTIFRHRLKLYPKTMDFYELAYAYWSLAKLHYYQDEYKHAYIHLEQAELNLTKMRSIWLVEDIRIWKPLLAIEDRSVKIACVLPQFILAQIEKISQLKKQLLQ